MFFSRFIPKEVFFFDYFEEHCGLALEACKELVELSKPGANIGKHVNRIGDLELQADGVTHRCIRALQQTFITPFDRTHIHDLICGLDDIMDAIDDASSRISMYQIAELRPEAVTMVNGILQTVTAVAEGVRHLRNLKNEDAIKKICIAVHRLENEGDVAMRAAVGRLFQSGDSPVEIIKWKEIFESLEHATDRCEDVADIVQAIVIEAS